MLEPDLSQWYTLEQCTHLQLPDTGMTSKDDHPRMFALEKTFQGSGLLMPRTEKRYYIANPKHICCKCGLTYHLLPKRWFFVLVCFFSF